MADWIVDPFVSFGRLFFGASPRQVRATLGRDPRVFQKGSSPNRVEAYGEVGIHAHYDAHDKLDFIDSFPPCTSTYLDTDLSREDTFATLNELRALGLRARDDRDGSFWFDDHGFVLYAPNGRTEGVSTFRRGYDTG